MSLDDEIAEARAQRAALRARAAEGDQIAALVVTRLDAAEAEMLERWRANFFREPNSG